MFKDMKKRYLSIVAVFFVTVISFSQKAPILGWSSWNNFHININEKMIKEQADALVKSGMYKAGYRFINIDDGYFGGRDANGNLQIDTIKFPSGMRNVTNYIHAKKLKAGIYTDAGECTCGSMWNGDKNGIGAGIFGHIEPDCKLFFKDWNFDFLKVDWCGGEKLKLDEQTEYLKILNAVKSINSDIVFNICRWQFPGEWAINKADSWRISGDIDANFSSILHIIDLNADLYKYASAGHYNDMDMLQVGRGMSYDEDKTHFSMWCMMNSPLLAGNDLRNMSKQTIEILTNREIIALNQDKGFKQAVRFSKEDDIEIWIKELDVKGESKAVALMNRSGKEKIVEISPEKIGLTEKSKLRDLWLHKNLGKIGQSKSFTIPKHGIVVLKIN